MSTPEFTFNLTGAKELLELLDYLPDRLVNRSMARINNAVMEPMLERAQELAPNVTGATRASLGIKTKVYKNSGAVFTIIGPTPGHAVPAAYNQTTTAERMRTSKAMKVLWHDPVKTSHLVEYGHGGPHPAPAHPFMRAAFDGQRSLIGGRYETAMRDEIARLVKRRVL